MRLLGALLVCALLCSCAKEEPEVKTPAPEPPRMVKEDPKPAKPVVEPPVERPKGFNENRVVQLSDLETVTISVGGRKLEMWLMDDDSRRAEGMMFLKASDVPNNKGMLFVFPDETERGFWMQNVEFDLDTAFVAADGTVVSTALMKAHDETTTPSGGAAQYVIEMKAGSFKRVGIRKGVKVTLPSGLKSF